jgi:HAMP domain-containing protein
MMIKENNPINSLTFKAIIPVILIIIVIITVFSVYLTNNTVEKSKEYLIENVLMQGFEVLAKERSNGFVIVEELTRDTAEQVEKKLTESKKRTDTETNKLFYEHMSKMEDGAYRSSLDKSLERYQMAAFYNNKKDISIRDKAIIADAFLYFEAFCESLNPFVFTTYVATNNSIWQYGFPDWALTSSADETFGQYNWFYEADPDYNPNKEHTWTDMYYDDLQEQWMVSSLMPIYDGEEFIGIIGQDFVLKDIIEVTKGKVVGETGILFFVDNLDNIVAHPETEFLVNEGAENDARLDLKNISDKPLTKVLQELPDEKGYMFTEEKNRRIVMHFPLESIDWDMIYVINESELVSIAIETNRQYIVSFVIFASLVIIIISLISRYRVINPIKRLMVATKEIQKGNLNRKIEGHSKDEIGKLAKSFDEMRIGLKDRNELLNSLLKGLEGKIGKLARILMRKNVSELAKRNPRITKIIPKEMARNIELNKGLKEDITDGKEEKQNPDNIE